MKEKTAFITGASGGIGKAIVEALLESGYIDLDYVVEIRGAQAERNKFKLTITSDRNEPKVYWGESRFR